MVYLLVNFRGLKHNTLKIKMRMDAPLLAYFRDSITVEDPCLY